MKKEQTDLSRQKRKKIWKTVFKVLTTVMTVAVVVVAILIMRNGSGLSDTLDFGAGAYFYADIPEFEKYTGAHSYITKVPYWVHVALFLIWGCLMFKLWEYIDSL